MKTFKTNIPISKWLPLVFGAGLLITFFLPWVSWQGNLVSGYDMPAGHFFSLAETKFGLGNPVPQLNFSFYAFWIIPAGVIASLTLFMLKKKWSLVAFVTGAISLSLVAVFFLFTQKLIMLGVGQHVFSMMCPAAWLHAFSAIGLIITAPASKALLKKIIWITAGPVLVYFSFMIIEKKLMNETFSDTTGIKPDYTVTASGLIHEFVANDSAANHKYLEKIIEVSGIVSEAEVKADSTVNIIFADSTGSYINFSLDKNQYEKGKNVKPGETISLKGACSGSLYSEILQSTAISFKRSVLIKK